MDLAANDNPHSGLNPDGMCPDYDFSSRALSPASSPSAVHALMGVSGEGIYPRLTLADAESNARVAAALEHSAEVDAAPDLSFAVPTHFKATSSNDSGSCNTAESSSAQGTPSTTMRPPAPKRKRVGISADTPGKSPVRKRKVDIQNVDTQSLKRHVMLAMSLLNASGPYESEQKQPLEVQQTERKDHSGGLRQSERRQQLQQQQQQPLAQEQLEQQQHHDQLQQQLQRQLQQHQQLQREYERDKEQERQHLQQQQKQQQEHSHQRRHRGESHSHGKRNQPYSDEERRMVIARFLEKRKHMHFGATKYKDRKQFAEHRPRSHGRFVKIFAQRDQGRKGRAEDKLSQDTTGDS